MVKDSTRLEKSVANDLEDSCNVEPDYAMTLIYWPNLFHNYTLNNSP